MRKALSYLIFSIFLTESCVMESPITCYVFKIVNKTSTTLIIESKSEWFWNNNLIFDTLGPNQELKKTMPKHQCFMNYHDTLIHSFFQVLQVESVEGNLKIDPFKRTHWIDSCDFLRQNKCKGGNALYILEVKESDLKKPPFL